jgi:hypothetical protein
MFRRTFLSLALIAAITPAWAGEMKYNTEMVPGVVLDGYDATSYFNGTPQKGDEAITTKWQGVSWRFASKANKALFEASPEKYAPQYGGFCAFAAAKNALAPGDPLAWTVHKGKLYINFSTDVRKKWSKDIEGYVTTADKNWPDLVKQ